MVHLILGEKMITDKILIFFNGEVNINFGGPSGFLAHNLMDKPRDFFQFSSDNALSPLSPSEKIIFSIQKKLYAIFNKKEDFIQRYICTRHYRNCNAQDYKYLYFHDCETLYACRDLISKNQIVILQSHSPELPSVEYLTYSGQGDKYQFILDAEKFSFKRANIIVFPNEECLELYKDIINTNSSQKFILSGAKSSVHNNKIEHPSIRKDKINLLYIGRRNKIKGFDIVLSAFKQAYKTNKNINLIIVGNGEKIEEEGVIDVGFQKFPHDWYNSVDYLINANRQSYFDLSIIEAISTGVPIIMAENYGHKWFKNKSDLITMFDGSVEELSSLLKSDCLMKRDYTDESNILLYKTHLSDELYYSRFKAFFAEITQEYGK